MQWYEHFMGICAIFVGCCEWLTFLIIYSLSRMDTPKSKGLIPAYHQRKHICLFASPSVHFYGKDVTVFICWWDLRARQNDGKRHWFCYEYSVNTNDYIRKSGNTYLRFMFLSVGYVSFERRVAKCSD